jgi:hypothetical protein
MNRKKLCQQKNSDSSKKFVRMPLVAIRRGPVLYTPKKARPRRLSRWPVPTSPPRRGDSARGSARDGPARLRFTSLRPPPAAAPPDPPATCVPNGRRSRRGASRSGSQAGPPGPRRSRHYPVEDREQGTPGSEPRPGVGLAFLLFVGAGSGFEPECQDT